MNNSPFDYLEVKMPIQFFRELESEPDFTPAEGDTTETLILKAERLLGFRREVKAMLDTPGWRALEQILLKEVRDHDNDIWSDILAGDSAGVSRRAIERVGIHTLLYALNGIPERIEASEKDIRDLKAGQADPAPTAEELTNG